MFRVNRAIALSLLLIALSTIPARTIAAGPSALASCTPISVDMQGHLPNGNYIGLSAEMSDGTKWAVPFMTSDDYQSPGEEWEQLYRCAISNTEASTAFTDLSNSRLDQAAFELAQKRCADGLPTDAFTTYPKTWVKRFRLSPPSCAFVQLHPAG